MNYYWVVINWLVDNGMWWSSKKTTIAFVNEEDEDDDDDLENVWQVVTGKKWRTVFQLQL
jgi:hypothetical protein